MKDDHGGPAANPYAAPQAAMDPAPAGPGDAPTREELEAFVGKNTSYYWRKSARQGHGTGLLVGWNWAAALLNLLWMLYRRMWKEFWIVVGVLMVWGMGEALFEEFVPGQGGSRTVERIGNLVYLIIMGMIGNGLYLRRARREVLESRRLLGSDPAGQRAHLARRGGTSWMAALIGAAVFLAVLVLSAMVADSEALKP